VDVERGLTLPRLEALTTARAWRRRVEASELFVLIAGAQHDAGEMKRYLPPEPSTAAQADDPDDPFDRERWW
jgi:hypothetical protein